MAQGTKGQASAYALGLAGLIPFFGAALALWFGSATLRGAALLALLSYAAVILSFLGGARWGVEVARPGGPRVATLIGAVAASLIAWALLIGALAISPAWQIGGFMLAFGLQGAWDKDSSALADWYRRLRLWLTIAVELALAVALVWALHTT